jgi:hypothetical protein
MSAKNSTFITKAKIEEKRFASYDSHFQWFLFFSLLLVLIEMVFPEKRTGIFMNWLQRKKV